VAGRAVALAALALAKFEVHSLHISDPKATSAAHAGLLGADAAWYQLIAAHGYGAAGTSALRFFPLLPVTARLLHDATSISVGVSILLIVNACALVASMVGYVLAKFELGDAATARRVCWLLNLVPPAFVLVMGYSEAILVLVALGCFLGLRTGRWWWAALFGFLAGTARPIGCLLVVPAVVEAMRYRRGGLRHDATRHPLVGRAAAVAAPVAGALVYLVWVQVEFGDFFTPFRVQAESSHHGLADPVTTIYHNTISLLHGHHVGTGLHLPWIVVALALAVVALRVLPVSYGLYALVVLAAALSGSNLDGFERYGLSAFPLLFAAATLLRSRRVEILVLTLCSAGMVAYALLAFVGAYVP
jgi:Gpi18-like mannosyltransferase